MEVRKHIHQEENDSFIKHNSLLHFVIINENGPTRDQSRCTMLYGPTRDRLRYTIRGQEQSISFWRSDTYASVEWLLSIKCENEERVFYYFVFYFFSFSLTLANLMYLKSIYHLRVELFKEKSWHSLYENVWRIT